MKLIRATRHVSEEERITAGPDADPCGAAVSSCVFTAMTAVGAHLKITTTDSPSVGSFHVEAEILVATENDVEILKKLIAGIRANKLDTDLVVQLSKVWSQDAGS